MRRKILPAYLKGLDEQTYYSLTSEQTTTWAALERALTDRFHPKESRQVHISTLRAKLRYPDEEEHGCEIARLVELAYPDDPPEILNRTDRVIPVVGAKVLVYRGLPQQVLIGIDFLMDHKCTVREDPVRWSLDTSIKITGITVAETVTLSPNMVADKPCEIQGVSGLDEFMGVVEPRNKFSERYSAGAFRTAVTVKEGRIPVHVFNCLNKPLKIYRCSGIGDLHPLASMKELPEESGVGEGYKVIPPRAPKENGEVELEARQCSWKANWFRFWGGTSPWAVAW